MATLDVYRVTFRYSTNQVTGQEQQQFVAITQGSAIEGSVKTALNGAGHTRAGANLEVKHVALMLQNVIQ